MTLQIKHYDSDTPWMDTLVSWVGMEEVPGSGNNPDIVTFFDVSGFPEVKTDSTAWCSATMNAAFHFSGLDQFMTKSLLARSWLNAPHMQEVPLEEARYGDIVILRRGGSSWQGHVTAFTKWIERGERFQGLGGNQSDEVNRQTFSTENVIGVRRPLYNRLTPELPVQKPVPPTPVPAQTPVSEYRTTTWGAIGASILAGIQSNSWLIGAVLVLIVCAIVGYMWWRQRK